MIFQQPLTKLSREKFLKINNMNNQSNRNEENRNPQEPERKTNTAQERKDQQQDQQTPDPTEMDRHEGKMDNGELGGNLRKDKK